MYCEHLDQLHTDMENRFVDLTTLDIPHWLSSPLRVPKYDEPGLVEEEIKESMLLNTDFELHPKLQVSFQDFWLQNKISESYPALWRRVNLFFIAFPTSYLVERGFSAVVQILGKQRQKLDITERGDLRLFLSNIQPDIEKLISSHQAQPSH